MDVLVGAAGADETHGAAVIVIVGEAGFSGCDRQSDCWSSCDILRNYNSWKTGRISDCDGWGGSN